MTGQSTSIFAKRYDTSSPVEIRLEGERIAAIDASHRPFDVGDLWIAPGFVDLQINGVDRRDFNQPNLSVEDVEQIALGADRMGVTGFLATVTTDSHERLANSIRTIAAAIESSNIARDRLLGIHLEGPWISDEDGARGAHPSEHVRNPSIDEFAELHEASRGWLKLVTLAPEREGSLEVIKRMCSLGVRVAIGHTAANAEQITVAVDAGATLSTHLGNGAHSVLPRHPNYLWDQLAEDRLSATLIADGRHLPPATLKAICRAKGIERCMLVSDLTGLAGAAPGIYSAALGKVEVLADGTLVVAGQTKLLAGASQPIGLGVANLMRFAQYTLKDAIEAASIRPRAFLGAATTSPFEIGSLANLVLFDSKPKVDSYANHSLSILGVWNHGKKVFSK